MPSEEEIICCKKYLKEGKGLTSIECSEITGKTYGNSSRQLLSSKKTGYLYIKEGHNGRTKINVFYPSEELIQIVKKKRL